MFSVYHDIVILSSVFAVSFRLCAPFGAGFHDAKREVVTVAKLPKLETRRRAFAEEYIKNGGNAYKAALAAGYKESFARCRSYELPDAPAVAAYIEARRKQLAKRAVTPERVLLELCSIGFGERKYPMHDMFGNEYAAEPALGARTKALELMGKCLGLFDGRGAGEAPPDDGFLQALRGAAGSAWADGDDSETEDSEP